MAACCWVPGCRGMRDAVSTGCSPQTAAQLSAPPPAVTKAALPSGPRIRGWTHGCGAAPGRAVPVLQEVTAASEPFPTQGSETGPRCPNRNPGEGGGRWWRSRGKAGSRVRRGWQKAARCEPSSASAWLIVSCAFPAVFLPPPPPPLVPQFPFKPGVQRVSRRRFGPVLRWEVGRAARPPAALGILPSCSAPRLQLQEDGGELGLALFRYKAFKKSSSFLSSTFSLRDAVLIAESRPMSFGCAPGGNVPLPLVPPVSSVGFWWQVGSPYR